LSQHIFGDTFVPVRHEQEGSEAYNITKNSLEKYVIFEYTFSLWKGYSFVKNLSNLDI
jgi:hypothetical protein